MALTTRDLCPCSMARWSPRDRGSISASAIDTHPSTQALHGLPQESSRYTIAITLDLTNPSTRDSPRQLIPRYEYGLDDKGLGRAT